MLPEMCRVVIPIKLEFSASVGFIDKETVGKVYKPQDRRQKVFNTITVECGKS
jgi:hypothetical protein